MLHDQTVQQSASQRCSIANALQWSTCRAGPVHCSALLNTWQLAAKSPAAALYYYVCCCLLGSLCLNDIVDSMIQSHSIQLNAVTVLAMTTAKKACMRCHGKAIHARTACQYDQWLPAWQAASTLHSPCLEGLPLAAACIPSIHMPQLCAQSWFQPNNTQCRFIVAINTHRLSVLSGYTLSGGTSAPSCSHTGNSRS